ncbi:MAG: glycerophosphoryl diester phosphodiesterase membrane domain-containing protein [Carbonactinosporaceae bacterium]
MTDTPGWSSPGQQGPARDVPPGWSQQQPPPQGPPVGWGGEPAAGWQWGQPSPPEVKPGIIPLRPLGVGEILDGAISCIRAYPRAMLGLSAIIVTIAEALQVIMQSLVYRDLGALDPTLQEPSLSEVSALFAGSLTAFGVGGVVSLVAILVLTGMLTVIVSRGVLGQPVAVRRAWAEVRPLLLRLAGLALLTLLIVAAAFLAGLLPGLVAALAGAPEAAVVPLIVLGGVAGVVAALYLYYALALATPALVLERQPIRKALGRSRRLVRGSWWRVFGILLLASLIAQLIATIIVTPFAFLGMGPEFFTSTGAVPAAPSLLSLCVAAIGGIIAGTITYPFGAGVGVLLYVDQRMRREALDLELARAAGVTLPGR